MHFISSSIFYFLHFLFLSFVHSFTHLSVYPLLSVKPGQSREQSRKESNTAASADDDVPTRQNRSASLFEGLLQPVQSVSDFTTTFFDTLR